MSESDEIKVVTVCGASDDLIEVEGALTEEHDCYSAPWTFLRFNEGTVLRVAYGEKTGEGGFWRITVAKQGSASVSIVEGTDEENDYSDTATLTGDLTSVEFGSKADGPTEGELHDEIESLVDRTRYDRCSDVPKLKALRDALRAVE